MEQQPYLEFEEISKQFPGVRALDRVSFAVREGSSHALLGENGAGKSTLLKVLSGAHRPNGGKLRIGGEAREFLSAQDAFDAGVAVIYQELNLVGDMSVEENLSLGHMPNYGGWVNRREMRTRARKALSYLKENIHPGALVKDLSIGQQQMVEIAKALMREAKVIAFDEPTSSLSKKEVEVLFDTIRELRAAGKVIIYVSHRLEEVFEICDGVTVFRDGKKVVTFESLEGVTHDVLVSRMVGRSIDDMYNYTPRTTGKPALEINGVEGRGLRKPATFTLHQGEVLGVFGLVGAGRTELMRLVFGAEPRRGGTISVGGEEKTIRSAGDAIRCGLALCPEDRKQHGIVPVLSVAENINLSVRRSYARFGFFTNEKRERQNAERFVDRLRIKTPSLNQTMKNLSGGNQQKSILARWLSEDTAVFLMDEPTRGIDVGTKTEIYSIIFELAAAGKGVVVVSSELPEILGISDRIIVMREGEVVASVAREEASEEVLLKLALPVVERQPEVARAAQ